MFCFTVVRRRHENSEKGEDIGFLRRPTPPRTAVDSVSVPSCHVDAARAHTAALGLCQEHKNVTIDRLSPFDWMFTTAGGVPPHGAHHRVLWLRQEHLLGRNRRLMLLLCDGGGLVETKYSVEPSRNL